ncbi:MAG: hypothetical protein KDK70_14040 [Myxococcales bacterium]|nr:hypothetical protein [Myxococcales bacterium]
MKRRLGWILALGAGLTTITVTSSAEAKGEPRRWGGFGHGFGGIVAGDLSGSGSALSDDAALGSGGGPIVLGGMVGGGGRMLLGRRLMLGGKGYALITAPAVGRHGSARLLGGGGGLDVGVAVYNDRNWLVYPYLGVQGFGVGLELRNDADITRRVGDVSLAPGQSRGLSAGFAMLEAGAGAQRLLFGDGHRGLMVGLELGFLYGITGDRWQLDDADVTGLGTPSLTGGYLRLTLGGGGFMDGQRRRKRGR